ncbi:50S ribosomal protein L24 [endosymbiont 'TC1' of Trimyema compressum]|uniref:50S ribosomal protein L24 n=1 Tax=endosymbiont 'TC1' of Trimyema compressum TaxID=243899 RepID=UPI0007F05016|nr:50S ribosomal protein L24 [endosymbiont 'TC1' of Trimyema compressum]AMP20331.1 50S ribosomal protein L24 [endosymbiont 'TC1' of Trimyema compressum]
MTPHLHVKKGDKVEIIVGKDKNKNGKILESYPSDGKVLVKGINKVKRHTKGTQKNPQGGIIEKEAPIQASNVLLFCSKCNRGVRHGHEVKEDKKVRVCKKCGKVLD